MYGLKVGVWGSGARISGFRVTGFMLLGFGVLGLEGAVVFGFGVRAQLQKGLGFWDWGVGGMQEKMVPEPRDLVWLVRVARVQTLDPKSLCKLGSC